MVPKKTPHELFMLCLVASTEPVLCNATERQTAIEGKYTMTESEE